MNIVEMAKKQTKKMTPIRTMLNVKYKGFNVVELKYKYAKTKKEIEKEAQRVSNQLAESGFEGKISVCFKYPTKEYGKKYNSGTYTDVGEKVKLYDPEEHADSGEYQEEPDVYESFNINIMRTG